MMPMRRLTLLSLILIGPLTFVACGGDDDDGPGGIQEIGGAAGGPGASGASGTSGQASGGAAGAGPGGSSPSGGAAGSAGGSAGQGGAEGGAAGSGGAVDVVGGSTGLSGNGGSAPVDDPSPICKPNQPWMPNPLTNPPMLPSGANGAIKEQRTLSSLSGSGLTIAWTTQDKIFYADRDSAEGVVQQYQQLPSSLEGAGYPVVDKVALSGDGKRLVMVSLDRTRLGELSRSAIKQTFGSAIDENPFAEVVKARQSDEQIADPVLVADDTALYLSFYKVDSSRLVVSKRPGAGQPWGAPVTLDDPLLASPGASRKRLWWVSKDQLTVFLVDPTGASSQAIWRKNLGKPFESTLPIGNVRAPYTDDACVLLTYSAPSSANLLDVFLAKKI